MPTQAIPGSPGAHPSRTPNPSTPRPGTPSPGTPSPNMPSPSMPSPGPPNSGVSNPAASSPGLAELAHDPAELGELERSILQLLWQHGTLSADQVREELEMQDRPLKDSTVRTVLRRLEEKGYLTHILDNRTFLYSPAAPAPLVAGRAVKRILEWFCEGSVEQLLVGMVDSSVLDREELQRLAERIAKAQTGDKGQAKGNGGK